ncbi:MFS transporter [Winogradskya humida]|uniref:MFS transporter n=1 Tax=Winogradskya humida TaxID=113566 RepID=A0ABQ3ZUL5_9ACTN|nr:MFS transporter [Actinoplanes humidus]
MLVLSVPGAARFFVPAAVARLGVAISGLAVLWAVHGATGSFGRAGAATGAFAVADAAAGPQIARLIDRWGQRRIVPVTASVFVAAGIGLVLACCSPAPAWVMAGLAAVAGATAPPVGALSAARWRETLTGGETLTGRDVFTGRDAAGRRGDVGEGGGLGSAGQLPAAMALEGVLNDVTFLVGPLVVTALSATVAPWSGLVLVVVLVAGGMAGLLSAGATTPAPGRSAGGTVVDHRLVNRPFLVLFAANLAMGFFFGGIGVAITAFALAQGAGAWGGVITAAGGVVSLGAGLAYGARAKGQPTRVMIAASTAIALGCALLAATPSVPVMVLGYAFVGGCVALVLIPASVVLQRVIEGEVFTQAMVWINSASAIGIATAAPLVGHLIQHHGWPAGFLALATLTTGVPLTLLIGYPALNAAQHRPH